LLRHFYLLLGSLFQTISLAAPSTHGTFFVITGVFSFVILFVTSRLHGHSELVDHYLLQIHSYLSHIDNREQDHDMMLFEIAPSVGLVPVS